MNQGRSSVAISVVDVAVMTSCLVLVLALSIGLAACGQRGPLTLPKAAPSTAPASSPASAP